MPTYKYRCKECGHEFEVRQRMSDNSLTECPVCGGAVRRVVGSVGIVFKGSGFYVTDNRNGKGRGKTAEKSSDTSEKSKKEGKSEKSDRPNKSDKNSE